MDVYLMRHGIAEPRRVPGRRGDAERALTKRGEKKVRRIAKVLRRQGIDFDLILSSPFRRARETANALGDVFRCADRVRCTGNLKVGGNAAALIGELKLEAGPRTSVLLVGHEPYLSILISVLLTGSRHLAMTMKKGSICKLSVDELRNGRCATLEWLMTPAQMMPR